jgi:hypothetical protein
MSPIVGNALTFIDGIISSLSRGGPGREGFLDTKLLNSFRQKQGLIPEIGLDLRLFEERYYVHPESLKRTKMWHVRGDSSYPALMFARAYLEVLYDGIPKIRDMSFESQFSVFTKTRLWPSELFVKFAKYCTVYPMAKFLHNDLPEPPEGWENRHVGSPLLFSGAVKRILKNRLVTFSSGNLRLWNSVLQGVKRGCAVVGEEYIASSMLGHMKNMTAEDPINDVFHDKIMDYTIRLLNLSSEFACDEPIKHFGLLRHVCGVPFPVPRPRLLEASTSAAWQITRDQGGAREYIRDEQEVGLARIVEISPGVIEELHGRVAPSFSDAVKVAMEEPTDVMVSAVLEPLKVRLITKGQPYKQWVSRFFQKGMWDYLQKYPQFVLTGRPLDVSDLEGILIREQICQSRIRSNYHGYAYPLWDSDKPRWVSGDFSAATDNQSVTTSKVVLELLLSRCQYQKGLKSILRSVLYEQVINYPDRICNALLGKLHMVFQSNGQLMGSILSFPVLCIVNFLCYWISFEERFHLLVRPQDLPVLVNGDDILFRADQELYDLWQETIRPAGFKLSVGKNYIHESVLIINSECFLFTEDTQDKRYANQVAEEFTDKSVTGEILVVSPQHSFKPIPFFNVGLLTGQSKLTGRESARKLPLNATWDEVCSGALDESRAFRRFVHYNREHILEQSNYGEFNLFVPTYRGGLGMRVPRGWSGPAGESADWHITSFQQRFASLLKRMQEEDILSGCLPSGGSLGIVRDNPVRSRLDYHHKRLLRTVPYGPLEIGLVDPIDTRVSLPILLDQLDPEVSQVIRFPRNLNELRKNPVPLMSYQEMCHPAPRYVEYNGTPLEPSRE